MFGNRQILVARTFGNRHIFHDALSWQNAFVLFALSVTFVCSFVIDEWRLQQQGDGFSLQTAFFDHCEQHPILEVMFVGD